MDVDNGDATNPVDIWCPGENKIIWTPGYSVVNEVKKDNFKSNLLPKMQQFKIEGDFLLLSR